MCIGPLCEIADRAGTAPNRIAYSLRDVLSVRTGQYPSPTYLEQPALTLKGTGAIFQALGQGFQSGRVGFGPGQVRRSDARHHAGSLLRAASGNSPRFPFDPHVT